MLQRRLGEAVRSSGEVPLPHHEDGFPQGTTETTSKATSDLPDPYQVPKEMKHLFAGPKVFPLSSGNTTPREERATSSKDVQDVVKEKPSPETLLVKALQSMMGKGNDDGKPKAKEAETIKLLDFPTPETYRSWRLAAREAIRAAVGDIWEQVCDTPWDDAQL